MRGTLTVDTQPMSQEKSSSQSRLRRISRLPRKWDNYTPYLFILPFFLFFAIFGIWPLIYAFNTSLTDLSGSIDVVSYVGFNNYWRLLHDSYFWQSLGNSLYLWFAIVPPQTLLAILVASLLSSPKLKLRWFFRTVFLTPFVVPLVAVAMVWQVLFDQNSGAINQILSFLHMTPIGWLTTTTWAKPTVAILVLWKSSGFAILIFLAALQNIPTEFYEAAGLDGANKLQIFVKITLPLLKRSVAFFMVTSTLGIIQMFVEPSVLTAGGPENSTTTAGFRLMGYLNTADYGMGAANSFLLMLIVIIVALVMIRMMTGSAEG